jgi:cytochrome c553
MRKWLIFITVTVTLVFVVLLGAGLPMVPAAAAELSRSPDELLKLGERMYRNGILPSGQPMQAFVKGEVPASGTAFSCASCHLRSGIGSVEGGVVTPPINGESLFKPVQVYYKGTEQKNSPLHPRRAAYDEASLSDVIRAGKNPEGAVLNDVMPRYQLGNEDMKILISYLKTLSAQLPPGVTDSSIQFATVIAEDVPADVRAAMLAPLLWYVTNKNSQADFYKTPRGNSSRLMVEKMFSSKELSTRKVGLSQWILKGAPETWRSQLEEYNRKEPAFALLGGVVNTQWQIIHRFSEDNKIPCLMPQTDFPVISDTDWYTLYSSKGYYQEGEAAARYLNTREDIAPDRPFVQIVRETEAGKALAKGFTETWRDLERRAVVTINLKADQAITQAFIERLMAQEKPAAVILWDGPEVQSALAFMAAAKLKPELVLVSSRYLGTRVLSLPEPARDFTFITYPYSFALKSVNSAMGKTLVEDESVMRISVKDFQIRDAVGVATLNSNSITQLVTTALMEMRGYYYRDYFFDVIGLVPDQTSPLYGRLSFGADQRYAAKGCYIVQVTKGPEPEIVRKSPWMIH